LLIAIAVISLAFAIYGYFARVPVYDLPTYSGYRTYYADAFGRTYSVRITEEAVARMPVWDKHHEHPPLVLADKLRLRMIKEKKLVNFAGDGRWKIRAAELTPAADDRWFWLVRFEYSMDQTGSPNEILIPVLMDGTVLEPEITEKSPIW
jgi:hypothetical protein